MICKKCKEDKPAELFKPAKRLKSGREGSCRKCRYIPEDKEKRRIRTQKYRDSNPKVKVAHYLRNRLKDALKGIIKAGRTFELTGCTVEELTNYLVSKFTEGMTLDNYGTWHIDHIIPCATFNLELEEEQKKCFHYTNLQPLWKLDNLSKGSKSCLATLGQA